MRAGIFSKVPRTELVITPYSAYYTRLFEQIRKKEIKPSHVKCLIEFPRKISSSSEDQTQLH